MLSYSTAISWAAFLASASDSEPVPVPTSRTTSVGWMFAVSTRKFMRLRSMRKF